MTILETSHLFADGDTDYVSNLNDLRSDVGDVIDEVNSVNDQLLVSPKKFGAVGDYTTNDTAALDLFFAHLDSTGATGHLGDGIYRYVGSLDLPEGIRLKGNGPPNLNTFIMSEDKANLRPGYKNLIKGSAIIFSGSANKTYTTNRSDAYSSFTYMLSYLHLTPCQIEGVGFILDCDVYTAGGVLTTALTDNRANYDAGLVVRSQLPWFNNINIFGYFDRAGFVVHSQTSLENVDSDYVRMNNSNICSIALIARDTTADNGLTGFIGVNNGYYSAADHHTTSDGDYTIPAIFIDGDNGSNGIRGHRFHGNVRTHSNVAVSLKKCDDVVFDCTWETPTLPGVPNADASGVIQGTADTKDVRVIAAASGVVAGLGLDILANTIGGSLITVGGKSGSEILVSRAGKGVRIGNDTTGDGFLQLTNDFATANSGWAIRRDDDTSDNLSFRYANAEKAKLTTAGALQIDGDLQVDTGSVSAGGVAELDLRSGDAAALVRLRNGATSCATFNATTATLYGGLVVNSGVIAPDNGAIELDLRSGDSNSTVRLRNGGTTVATFSPANITFTVTTAVRPTNDNVVTLGDGTRRWSVVYAGTGTINTSDANLKTPLESIEQRLFNAWAKVKWGKYKFLDAIEAKGKDNARYHFGVIAQQVKEAFESEGLNPFEYGILCYDEWPAQYNDDGELVMEAGSRYGIRYEEALALECAYLRYKLEQTSK